MNMIRLALCLLIVGTLSISCKSDTDKEGTEADVNSAADEKPVAVKQDLNKDNLLVKTMSTPEAKTFTSALVTTGLAEMMNENGPYTVFAPSVKAFEAMPQDRLNFYLNPENKDAFVQLIKNHMFEVDMGSSDLLQALRKDKNYELQSMGGATIKVTMNDGNLFLVDANGNEAALGKTDILASNGKLHLIETVLHVNAK